MKTTLFTLGFILSTCYAQAQCLTFSEDTLESCAGLPVTFTVESTSFPTTLIEQVDFNTGILPAGWSTSGGTTFSQPCGPGIDNTPYFWASTSGGGTPEIVSNTYDFTSGGSVTFDFYYALQGGAAPCEGPDLAHEGMELQYSTDGGVTWIPIVYFSPGGYQLPSNPGTTGSVSTGQTAYTVWNTQGVGIPVGAQTPNTTLRWVQTNSSGTCCDNWGVDNILVNATVPANSFVWNTGATTMNLTTSSTTDSTYTVSVFDNTMTLVCQDSVQLIISSAGFDNAIQGISQTFVQGLPSAVFIDAYNDGCPEQSGDIVVKLDPLVSFNSSIPPPSSITADSIIYNYSNLYLNGPHEIIAINVTTSPMAVVGDSVCLDMYITDTIGDVNPTNNFKNYKVPVMASYDPNDKKVYPIGDCNVGYVPNDQLMTYTIRFQNTGNSDAIDVRVNDILDSNLDPSTMRVVAASHNYEVDWVSPSVVDFLFDDINLPAQAQDEVGSNGYIVFEIEQVQGLAHGTEFENFVDIYFDFNAPITTNTVLNTVTDGTHYAIGDTTFINTQTGYSWNGELLTSSGVYTQVYPLPDGCDSTAYLSLTLESDAGLNSLSNNPFVIYPNPAKDHLVVEGTKTGELRIINAEGRVVVEQKIAGNDVVRWGELAAGIYVVEIESENKLYREKLVIEE